MLALTMSRAAVALAGLPYTALQSRTLTPEATRVLKRKLEEYGFDVRLPIYIKELPSARGFSLMRYRLAAVVPADGAGGLEQRACGELDGGVDGDVVSIVCDCGARTVRRVATARCSRSGENAS
jgi:hypothetical protein